MEVPLQSEVSIAHQLTAILSGTGFAPLDEAAWIRVSGEHRTRWLNGILTNSIQALEPGRGCYNFALNAQGRILGDMNVFAPPDDPDALLIQTGRSQVNSLIAHLDHYIIMDDVELADISGQFHGLTVVGPNAASVLRHMELPIPEKPLTMQSASWKDWRVRIIQGHSPLIPRYEVWSEQPGMDALQKSVAGFALKLHNDALECLRVLEGTPRYGVDIRNTDKAHDLPQETTQQGETSRALHFAKGCYLGQEIVERVRSRGNVHRAFSGFELTGALPPQGTALRADGKTAGELTTVAAIPLPKGTLQLGLGYVRREALERRLPLEYPGGAAKPVALPYRIAAADLLSNI